MKKRLFVYLSTVLVACVLSACAALTPSQVGEVKKFAEASEEYGVVPGALAGTYGTLLRNNKLLSLCRYSYGTDTGEGIDTLKANKAWDEIKNANSLEQEFTATGKRMDAALDLLKGYSKILTLIASDEFTDELDESAVNLGKSIDEATNVYNSKYRATNPLRDIGSDVGQVVRAAGGLYIKHRQAKILREMVAKADPMIQALMADVEDIALNSFKPDFINYEKNFLGPVFQSVANNNHRIDISLVSAVYNDLARARAGAALSGEVASAARAYAKAHRALLDKTRSRIQLKEAIEDIKVLGNEVDAAKKIKDSIKMLR